MLELPPLWPETRQGKVSCGPGLSLTPLQSLSLFQLFLVASALRVNIQLRGGERQRERKRERDERNIKETSNQDMIRQNRKREKDKMVRGTGKDLFFPFEKN